MKASKGFLLLDLAVVFLVVGTLLFFISTSFGGCVKSLNHMQDVVEAKSLAENFLADETIPISERWQVQKSEHSLQGNLFLLRYSLMHHIHILLTLLLIFL